MRSARVIGIVAASFCAWGVPVQAAETASLSGYAYVCSLEEPLPYANVFLESGSESRVVRADRNGRFVALGLAPGSYTIALRDVDIALGAVEAKRSDATMARITAASAHGLPSHTVASVTRTVRLVPNDAVAMRIGVGATLLWSPNFSSFHVRDVVCDPPTIPVAPNPINRTTIVSSQ